jgi:hypothetical protein
MEIEQFLTLPLEEQNALIKESPFYGETREIVKFKRTSNMMKRKLVFEPGMNSEIDRMILKELSSMGRPQTLFALMDVLGIIAIDLSYLRQIPIQYLGVFPGNCFKDIPEIIEDPIHDIVYGYMTGDLRHIAPLIKTAEQFDLFYSAYKDLVPKVYGYVKTKDETYYILKYVSNDILGKRIKNRFIQKDYKCVLTCMNIFGIAALDHEYLINMSSIVLNFNLFPFGCFQTKTYTNVCDELIGQFIARGGILNNFLYYFFTGNYIKMINWLIKHDNPEKEFLIKCLSYIPWKTLDPLKLYDSLSQNRETYFQYDSKYIFVVNYIMIIVNPYLTIHEFMDSGVKKTIPLAYLHQYYFTNASDGLLTSDTIYHSINNSLTALWQKFPIPCPVWRPERHILFPKRFKDKVFVLLCIRKRLYRNLDKNILFKIFRYALPDSLQEEHEYLGTKKTLIEERCIEFYRRREEGQMTQEELFDLCFEKRISPYKNAKQDKISIQFVSKRLVEYELGEFISNEEIYINDVSLRVVKWKHLKPQLQQIIDDDSETKRNEIKGNRKKRKVKKLSLLDAAKIYLKQCIDNNEPVFTDKKLIRLRKIYFFKDKREKKKEALQNEVNDKDSNEIAIEEEVDSMEQIEKNLQNKIDNLQKDLTLLKKRRLNKEKDKDDE